MSKETTKIEESDTQEGKVGTMLHDVRIKKKLNIEDIAQNLRIKTAYLIAIEQSDYANIPEAPYGIGFVRSYASYLGLNSNRIVQIFKEETNIKEAKATTISHESDEQQTEEETYSLNGKYVLISLIMFVLVYLLWALFSNEEAIEEADIATAPTEVSSEDYSLRVENFITETEEEVSTPSEIEQITVKDTSFVETKDETSAENETTKAVEPKEITTLPAEDTTKQGRVLLKIKKETWIEVKDDNKLWISKVMPAGSEYIVPDNGNGKTVSFGNTDGVDVIIDGKIVTIVSKNKKTNIQLDAFLGNH